MERWQSKVLALFIMWAIMLAVTLAPFLLVSSIRRRGQRGERLLCTLSCFTGGIFLGTCLVFLIPEVALLVGESLTRPLEITYPVAELIIGAGFFLVMFAEKLVHVVQGRNSILNVAVDVDDDEGKVREEILDRKYEQALENRNVKDYPVNLSLLSEEQRKASTTSELSANNNDKVKRINAQEKVQMLRKDSLLSEASSLLTMTESGEHSDIPFHRNAAQTTNAKDEKAVIQSANEASANAAAESAKTFILLMALSLDCVLGGVSLGLQRSVHAVWSVLLGICAHESVVGFSLGVQLSRTRVIRPAVSLTLAIGYATFGPLGVLIGTLIMESVNESRDVMLINGVLQGVATGVFIYVTFFEILNDKVNSTTSLRNIIAIFFGFLVMAAIAGITPSSGGIDSDGWDNTSSVGLLRSTVSSNETSDPVQDFHHICNCSDFASKNLSTMMSRSL